MKITEYKEDDFENLMDLWNKWGWGSMEIALLPPTGVVAWKDNKIIACAFWYETNTKLAFFDFFGSDPDMGKMEKIRVIKEVIATGVQTGIDRGYDFFYSISKNQAAHKLLEKLGFSTLEKGVNTMCKSFNNYKLNCFED